MTIQGKIHELFDTKNISEKFRKREFVIEYVENPMYPQYILLQFTQDKCELLDKFQKGQMVEVDFNLRGRSWTSPSMEVKYFNTLEAWRIKGIQDQVQVSPPHSQNQQAKPSPVQDAEVVGDDLPF